MKYTFTGHSGIRLLNQNNKFKTFSQTYCEKKGRFLPQPEKMITACLK